MLRERLSGAGLLAAALWMLGCSGSDDPTRPPAPCSQYPPQNISAYRLPYAVGSSPLVLQANCDQFSHLADGPWLYAYDFRMAIGTSVLASRAGTVVGVRENFADGNRVSGQENYVFVRHSDFTVGRYFHLTQNGALVSMGDVVVQGQEIGLSGDTGFSTEPHLHFDVAGCPATSCQTHPIVFSNTRAHPTGLVKGERYEALQ